MGMAFQSGRKLVCSMLAVWAVFLGIGTAGFSQSEAKQTLHGMVVDHTGAVVANFAVEISFHPTGTAAAQPEKSTAILAKTDQYGQFSASLLPGSYDVCVPRYPKSCRTIEIKASVTPESLALKISPGDEIPDPTLPESRFQKIAGPSAKNCGPVPMDKNIGQATACAMRAFKHHKPFYVIYDGHCMDCFSAHGLAWDSKGEPHSVYYDSMGISNDPPSPGSSMPDGFHTVVTPCSQPVRVYINEAGELDCFKDREMWEWRIERGNQESLLSAGETGYWELIPALKKRLADSESFDEEEEKTAIKMALAKLGDHEQQQELLCKLYWGSPSESQTVALDQIPYVGGWYAIRIYRELLTPAAAARLAKAKLRFREGDVALAEPRWWALSSLFKVLPDPLPAGIDYGFNLAQVPEYSQKWSAWIQQNERRLKKLKPTGAGIDFSGKSCKAKGGHTSAEYLKAN
jgi:hypothetical protein